MGKTFKRRYRNRYERKWLEKQPVNEFDIPRKMPPSQRDDALTEKQKAALAEIRKMRSAAEV